MDRPRRISYLFMLGTLAGLIWLHLDTPFLAVLFSYFALEKLTLNQYRHKWLALALFFVLVSGIFYGFVFFLNKAFTALPDIVGSSIPSVTKFARDELGINMELPFTDWKTFQALAVDSVRTHLRYFANFAKIATKEFAFVVIGIVVAISLFLNAKLDLGRDQHRLRNNLYSITGDQIAARFRTFYRSFSTVMGAQLLISAINTLATAVFISWIHLPYAEVIIGVTFLCGLLPIIGNLISNTIIVGIAITISPRLAIAALVFLVILHKAEYFLNSKIIGERIKNPMWLTLLGLIIGERLMGIPGMILAPVVLNYIKVETSQIEVTGHHEGGPGTTVEPEEPQPVQAIKVVH